MSEPAVNPASVQPQIEVAATGERIRARVYVDEFCWTCPRCGWLGRGLTSADEARREGAKHRCEAPWSCCHHCGYFETTNHDHDKPCERCGQRAPTEEADRG